MDGGGTGQRWRTADNWNLNVTPTFGNTALTVEAGAGSKFIARATSATGGVASIILNSTLDVVHNGSNNLTLGNGLSRVTGAGGINKSGTGTLVLAGANIYMGNTVVSAGALTLSDNAELRFNLGATTGVNNGLSGLGTATLNGDFRFDLTSDGTTIGNSWNNKGSTIADVAKLNETFGATLTALTRIMQ